ncbi:MAG TPA: adenylate/guanylate cyclase domain-containing protein [Saprospiraceae bacterium]|nr:adenylate/guanylate cyclase domain-containing protein [Saprospiraceae bacterium]
MTDSNKDRQLAAIFFADIEGYTALMQSDEGKTMQVLRRYQHILKEEVAFYKGKIIKNYGDGSICLFSSVLDAVQCARAIQEALPVIPLRIGLYLGDVMHEDNDVYGNDLNIASRIESMGIAGAVLMSKNVWDKVKNQSDLEFAVLGRFEFKNVEEPIELFALANKGFVVPKKDQMKGKLKATSKRPLARLVPALLALIDDLTRALMLADIYEEEQEYALAIQRLENIPYWNGYPAYAGYTNYRLTQLYEKKWAD